MTESAGWASAPTRQYRQPAIDEFMAPARSGAHRPRHDGRATVVTREQPAPDSKEKIKIPDVCDAFNVHWTQPFGTYRTLGLRLIA